MLRELGWIVTDKERDSPRNTECKLRPVEELMQMYKDLMYLKRKDADGFIGRVFHSEDSAWVERCESIVQDE